MELAKYVSSEIVNGDSGQFYTPLSIGTAKPDWKQEVVPHHLFDIIDEPKHFSVVAYRELLLEKINNIWSRGKLPVVVGGSGFYLKSIFFPPVSGSAVQNKEIPDFSGQDSVALWNQLHAIDVTRAEQIDKNDLYRIIRALSIWYQTGVKPSKFFPRYNPTCNFLMIYLSRDKDELNERINKRTYQMIEEGWLDEVERLQGTEWEPFLCRKGLIGYDILFEYLKTEKTEKDLEGAIQKVQQETRHYAKRQKTFWKSLDRQINGALKADKTGLFFGETELINLTLLDCDLYIKQLLKRLSPYLKKSIFYENF